MLWLAAIGTRTREEGRGEEGRGGARGRARRDEEGRDEDEERRDEDEERRDEEGRGGQGRGRAMPCWKSVALMEECTNSGTQL